jgi:hypothetical protein
MIKVIPSTDLDYTIILIDEEFLSYYLVLEKMNKISYLYPGVCIMTESLYLDSL